MEQVPWLDLTRLSILSATLALEAALDAGLDPEATPPRSKLTGEAGTDPALIARWTADVNTTRAAAQAQLRTGTGGKPARMTPDEINTLVTRSAQSSTSSTTPTAPTKPRFTAT